VTIIEMHRPAQRNAVNRELAVELRKAFVAFEADEQQRVAVLFGNGGHFSAGADLKAIAARDSQMLSINDLGPLGPTSLQLSKPVIAAVEGFAVAGGLELALWCDLRVCDVSAKFGVYCRRFGVPLIDGGTVRLPRIVGQGRALDMVLTGRTVDADEALHIGLANYVVPQGEVLSKAAQLAQALAEFPQQALRADRANVYRNFTDATLDGMRREQHAAIVNDRFAEISQGAQKFTSGQGRAGSKL
jgi:enoyl-CoA hydratase